jgi:hypothetical protein
MLAPSIFFFSKFRDFLNLQSQIFLDISGCLLPVNSLFCDETGIFVFVNELIEAKAANNSWICYYCGTENNGGSFCSLCMKRRKEA